MIAQNPNYFCDCSKQSSAAIENNLESGCMKATTVEAAGEKRNQNQPNQQHAKQKNMMICCWISRRKLATFGRALERLGSKTSGTKSQQGSTRRK